MAGLDFINNPNYGVQGQVAANYSHGMNALEAEKQLGEIAAQPAALDLIKARIAETNAQALERTQNARVLKRSADAAEMLSRLAMQPQGGQQPEPDMTNMLGEEAGQQSEAAQAVGQRLNGLAQAEQGADRMIDLSDLMRNQGYVVESQKIRKDALENLGKVASVRHSDALTQAQMLTSAEKSLDLIGRTLGSARNAMEYEIQKGTYLNDPANAQMDPRLRQAIIESQYSPQAVELLNRQAISAKEKVDQARASMNADETKRANLERERDRKFRSSADYAERNARIRADTVASRLGILDHIPSEANLRVARDALRRVHFGNTDWSKMSSAERDHTNTAAMDILADAATIVKSRKATSMPQAIVMAVERNAPYWEAVPGWTENPISSTISGLTATKKYNPQGTSAATAIRLPEGTPRADLMPGGKYDGKWIILNGQTLLARGGRGLSPADVSSMMQETPETVEAD